MNESNGGAQVSAGIVGPMSAERADAPTGDAAVDEALTRLATLDAAALREHVGVFTAVHDALQARLADTEG